MRSLVGKTISYTAPSGNIYDGIVKKEFDSEVEIKEIGQLSNKVWIYRVNKSQIIERDGGKEQ